MVGEAGCSRAGQGARTVRGRVVEADGRPVVGARVEAFGRRLGRADERLGKPARTDGRGRYVVVYAPARPRVDLYVRVRTDQHVLATSPIVLEAGDEETIDVVVGGAYRGPSEHERLVEQLAPVLEEEGVRLEDLADLDEQDLALLAARSGVEPAQLVLLKQSVALARQTGIAGELFYGLGRQKVALGLPALLAVAPDKRRAAARAALEQGQIPARLAKAVDKGLDELDARTVAEALRAPQVPGGTTLGGLLRLAGLPPAKCRKLVEAYLDHEGSVEDFWKRVRGAGTFSAGEVDRVQLVLQLAAVTQHHLPLVEALLEQGVASLEDLAGLERDDWRRLVSAQADAPGPGLPAHLAAAGLTEDDYAELLFGVVEQAEPTAMVAARIDAFPDAEPLARFFETNRDFDLRSTAVRAYLRQHPQALVGFPSEEEAARVTRRLQGLVRTYRIAPDGARVRTMQVLMADGLDSAQKVRALGRAAFVRRYGTRLGGDRSGPRRAPPRPWRRCSSPGTTPCSTARPWRRFRSAWRSSSASRTTPRCSARSTSAPASTAGRSTARRPTSSTCCTGCTTALRSALPGRRSTCCSKGGGRTWGPSSCPARTRTRRCPTSTSSTRRSSCWWRLPRGPGRPTRRRARRPTCSPVPSTCMPRPTRCWPGPGPAPAGTRSTPSAFRTIYGSTRRAPTWLGSACVDGR